MEKIILVDKNDKEIGTGEKLKVHKEGKLHRAFSIFIFNSQGQMLIQKRNSNKYHSGGLWSNTCCSHPRAGKALTEEIHERLKQEMGFDTDLKEIFSFIYKVRFDNNLYEHEFDHVYIGRYDNDPKPNPQEAEECKWIPISELTCDTKRNPDDYTYWFKAALERVLLNLDKLNIKPPEAK